MVQGGFIGDDAILSSTKMDFSKLGSLTRSNQLEFKNESFQQEYFDYLCNRVVDVNQNNPKDIDSIDNITIGFRKLRQGLISTSRRDGFAIQVYKISLDIAIKADNQDEIRVVLARLIDIGGDELYIELYQIHQLSTRSKILQPSTTLVRQLQRSLLEYNYFSYFNLLDNSTGHQRLLLQSLLNKFRVIALTVITKAYIKLPISKFNSTLRLDLESCKAFLNSNHWQLTSVSSSSTLNFKSRTVT